MDKQATTLPQHSGADFSIAATLQVLSAEGLTVPSSLRSTECLRHDPAHYAMFFSAIGLANGRRPRKPGEKGHKVRLLNDSSRFEPAVTAWTCVASSPERFSASRPAALPDGTPQPPILECPLA